MITSFEQVFPSQEVLKALRSRSRADQKIYLVGGVVRDALLGLENHDLDFVVNGDVRRLARAVAKDLGAAFYMMDLEHPTARVIFQGVDDRRCSLDFAALRGEDIREDLAGRDFSINAMAVDIDDLGKIIDPLKGAQDLKDRRLRACSPSAFKDDPVRLLRAVRLSLALQLSMDPATIGWLKEAAADLALSSIERQRDEFMRMLAGRKVDAAVRILDQFGLLEQLLPEVRGMKGVDQLPHTLDIWEHTLALISWLEKLLDLLTADYDEEKTGSLLLGMATVKLGRFRQQLRGHFEQALTPGRGLRAALFLAALLHDCGKPAARSVDSRGDLHFYGHDQTGAEIARARARALALSNDEIERIVVLIRHHMAPHFMAAEGKPASPRAIYRLFRETGEAGIELCLLALADTLATYGVTIDPARWERELDICRQLLEAWFDRRQQLIDPPRLVNGDDLMQHFQLESGPLVGKILEAVRENQAAGAVKDIPQALALAKNLLEKENREEE